MVFAVIESSSSASVRIHTQEDMSSSQDDHSPHPPPSLSSSPSRHITVVDVYDLAAAIGKDFERLIDQYGTDCVRGLMPKVCFV